MISRILCAGLVAAAACATPVQPAKAWGGGAIALGAALGVTTGVLLSRPYVYPYPYAYPYPYPYPYAYYPAPAYPAPVYAVPPTPVPYGYATTAPAPVAQAQPANPNLPTCGAGRFFNRLTGTCDRS
jgi:hypothetical protein